MVNALDVYPFVTLLHFLVVKTGVKELKPRGTLNLQREVKGHWTVDQTLHAYPKMFRINQRYFGAKDSKAAEYIPACVGLIQNVRVTRAT